MTKSEIFKAAHKLAKTFIGNYKACFSLAIREVLSSLKNTLKDLVGSEKQVKWANQIRQEMLNNVEVVKEAFSSDSAKIFKNVKDEAIELAISEIKEQVKAVWFIDNQNKYQGKYDMRRLVYAHASKLYMKK